MRSSGVLYARGEADSRAGGARVRLMSWVDDGNMVGACETSCGFLSQATLRGN